MQRSIFTESCKRRSRTWRGPLDTKRCDEDVHHNYDENKGCGEVLQDVQLVVHALIIQVPFDCQKRNQNMRTLVIRNYLFSPQGGSTEFPVSLAGK